MRHFVRAEKTGNSPHARVKFTATPLRAAGRGGIFPAMRRLSLSLAFLAFALPAQASSSNVIEADGVVLRLVSAGAAKVDGALDAVLEIGLAPGWKTYWIDPGEAGVPPSLTLADGANVDLRLPAPQMIDEGELKLVGYDRPVRFVARFPAGTGLIEADVFIGVCEKICVPVSGRLTLDPAHDPGNLRDAAIVEEALLALPGAPDTDFGAKATLADDATLTVEAAVPAEAGEASLFVASAADWVFGNPGPGAAAQGRAAFVVPAMRDAAAPWPAEGFRYVLVADGRAVEGRLLPP